MNYTFKPPVFPQTVGGVVKKVEGKDHYSTHLPPFDFEVDESNDMYICGKEYEVNEAKVIELYNSGYGAHIEPPYIPE